MSYIDAREYELREVADMPANVKVGIERTVLSRPDFVINPAAMLLDSNLSRLVKPFAERHSGWSFVGGYSHYSSAPRITELRVYKDREEIGTIGVSRRSNKFYVGSRKISDELERGRYRETGNIDKARKLLNTIFPKTYEEKGMDSKHRIQTGIMAAMQEVNGDVRRQFGTMLDIIKPYLMENLAHYFEVAKGLGMKAEQIERLKAEMEKLAVVEPMNEARRKGAGDYVLIENNVYVVSEDNSESVKPHVIYGANDQLPDYIKRGVGMLKLVGDHQFITGVGFRLSEDKFFVLKEQSI